MKLFIAVLLILSSFSDGKEPEPNTTTVVPSTTNTSTTTTTPTVTSTSTTTINTTQSTAPTPSPTADVSVNVTWTFDNGTGVTNVIMIVKNLKTSEWAAIGLGQNQSMGEAHVFICQRLSSDEIGISRYINPSAHDDPEPAGSEQGGVFTSVQTQLANGVVTCQFTLSNFTSQEFQQVNDLQPLSQSRSYYPLFAVGTIDSDNDLNKHYHDSRTALPNRVQLNQFEIILYKTDVMTTTPITTLSSTSPPSNTTQTTPSPTADVSVNVTWTFDNGTGVTHVLMIVKNLKTSEWAAIGLGQNQSMGEAHVFTCQRLSTDEIVIKRYINPGGHDDPEDAGSEQGGVLTPVQAQLANGVVTCQFTLSNFTSQEFQQVNDLQPLSQSRSYYPLFAVGTIDSDNELNKHYHDSRTALPNRVQLNQDEIILYKTDLTTTTAITTLSSTSPPSNTTQTTPSPTADVSVNVTWTFDNGTGVTHVLMIVKNLKTSEWAAIGLGQNQSMGEAHVFMCQRLPSDEIGISRYINPGGHDDPQPAGSEQGGVLTPVQAQLANGVVTCQFTLSNFTSQRFGQVNDLQPLSQSRSYYPLFAVGTIDSDYELNKHYRDSRTAQLNRVQLNQDEIILYKTDVTTTTAISTLSSTPTTASPTADVSVNVTWTFDSGTGVTNVIMGIKNLKTSEWAAIGLGQNQSMGEAHVFMCKRLSTDKVAIIRYINPHKHDDPVAAGSEQGGVLIPIQQQLMDSVVTCQFTLSNFTSQRFGRLNDLQPLSQSRSYYPIFAIGLLDSDGKPNQHTRQSRIAQSTVVQLNQDEIILYKVSNPDSDSSSKYVRAHGIIMIFTWILVVSTGVLIARYFKKSRTVNLICGEAAWYAAHRFFMCIAAILTILGFLFIFVALEGKWIDQGPTRPFAHSITGVLVISLAFFQPFIALFRCKPDSRYRPIFNYVHAFVGFSTLILSIATLFLATYFTLFKSDAPRYIMIVWTIWLVVIFIAFEVTQNYFRKKYSASLYTNINTSNQTIEEIVENPANPTAKVTRPDNDQTVSSEDKFKNILLATHFLVAAILSIIFSTQIA